MRRTLRNRFVTGSLALSVLAGLVTSVSHAQAPLRPVSGSYYYVSTRPPAVPSSGNPPSPARNTTNRPPANPANDYLPSLASTAAPAGGYYYAPQAASTPRSNGYYFPSRATAAAPAGGYYYPSQARATSPPPYYYTAPAVGNPVPTNLQRTSRPRPRSGDDEDYAYKS